MPALARSPLHPADRIPAIVFCLLLLACGRPADAATLTTGARVAIVPPVTVDLEGLDPRGLPVWSVGGLADEPVRISFEWRTSDGVTIEHLDGADLLHDGAGRIRSITCGSADAAVLAPPDARNPVLTLVIRRE